MHQSASRPSLWWLFKKYAKHFFFTKKVGNPWLIFSVTSGSELVSARTRFSCASTSFLGAADFHTTALCGLVDGFFFGFAITRSDRDPRASPRRAARRPSRGCPLVFRRRHPARRCP